MARLRRAAGSAKSSLLSVGSAPPTKPDGKPRRERAGGGRSAKKKKKRRVVIEEEDDASRSERMTATVSWENEEETEYLEPLTLSDAEGSSAHASDYDEDSTAEEKTARNIAPRPSLRGDGGGGVRRRQSSAVAKCVGSARKSAAHATRRRRRSSAKFLRLSGRFSLEGAGSGGAGEDADDANALGEIGNTGDVADMYRQCVRLNAANKISAANSWSLNLIDHMDAIIAPLPPARGAEGSSDAGLGYGGNEVNFTRASCTIDASVKIYSYRVDDVHLSSYKVLANLNRSDNRESESNGRSSFDGDNDGGVHEGDDFDEPMEDSGRSTKKVRGGKKKSDHPTLEKNISNLNITKLDSALDIDPLFHKMSATFDEGGAKGMLLNNLGVAADGCGIVFDSNEDTAAKNGRRLSSAFAEAPIVDSDGNPSQVPLGGGVDESFFSVTNRMDDALKRGKMTDDTDEIDVTALTRKLTNALGHNKSLLELSFVPQLRGLREDMAELRDEGHDTAPSPKKSKRYRQSATEEAEGEKIIHREHLERSQSQMQINMSTLMADVDENDADVSGIDVSAVGMDISRSNVSGVDISGINDSFAPDNFGGDDVDNEDYCVFNEFVATNEDAAKYSEPGILDYPVLPRENSPLEGGQNVLDYISFANGTGSGNNNYEFFNPEDFVKIMGGNVWAGAAHWKRCQKAKINATAPQPTKSIRASKRIAYMDLSKEIDEEIFAKPVAKKRGRAGPLQQTKAALQKQLKEDNLLPLDARIDAKQFTKLFLRPDVDLLALGDDGLTSRRRTVAFADDVMGDEASYGDDNEGPGFTMAPEHDFNNDNDDDECIHELEGVRKVDKISIGYSKVSKKVDVKRLKSDLWNEIEPITVSMDKMTVDSDKTSGSPAKENKEEIIEISFQDTVKKLSSSQGQAGVTVPFYFICLLHLANEKGLALDAHSLDDLRIRSDDGTVVPLDTAERPKKKLKGSQQKKQPEKAGNEEGGVSSVPDLDKLKRSKGAAGKKKRLKKVVSYIGKDYVDQSSSNDSDGDYSD
mmetsp:Transcript_17693/g.35285  ORF Transcript_17693/g.35285 Transcript_17693/m.35285 type:complete len:1034 (+) Transcript_17693:123-3224(+)|eukprot:CAMPEP_0194310038 /NCGR_PEP_ID=MMETSP0171-20130528/6993_1 /TAXON_ID=218684 /ORGANISM="Corethron pennatum, Strain L29A3" /LENGTH=1033 /DNA_ID=CAMNT_0039063475 /DNA_START=71 /DNA_END=3172 /DNA_ORIENTATION=-